MIPGLYFILNWSRVFLISALLIVLASAMSLTGVARCSDRHHKIHKILRMRGGDVVFRTGKGAIEAVDTVGHLGKSKQSVMRFASVAVHKDSRMCCDLNGTKPLKKSYQYYF
jgi:hypothetical protein